VVSVAPDVLSHGWRPPALGDRRRAGLALLLGVALVFAPFWVGPVAGALSPEDSYRYETVPIEPANGSVTVEDATRGLHTHGIQGVDCYVETDRACRYAYALRNGSVVVPDQYFQDPYGYVHLDRFYDPTVAETERGTRLSLEPVSGATVLADVSQDVGRVPSATARAVEASEATTSERLTGEGFVFEADEGYVLLALVDRQHGRGAVPLPPQSLLEFVGVVVGLGLLRVGWRDYDRWQGTDESR